MIIEEVQKMVLKEFEEKTGMKADYAYPVNQNQWMIMVDREQYIMTFK